MSQAFEGTAHVGLDGAEGSVFQGRDFGLGVAVEKGELERLTLPWGKGAELAHSGMVGLGGGFAGARGEVHEFVQHLLLGEGMAWGLSAGAAQAVDAASSHDEKEPGLDRGALRIKTARLPPDLHETVLQRLFCLCAGSEDAHRESEQARGKGLVEGPQRVGVARRDATQDGRPGVG